MDTLLRSGRLLLIVLAGAVACAPKAGAPVGTSDAPRGRGSGKVSADGGVIDGAASLPGSYKTTFTKANKSRLVSKGHTSERWEIDVYLNEPAQKALASRAREAEVGAIAVVEHFERKEGGAQGPVMVMEKKEKGFAPEHGDWRYAIVGSRGQLVGDGSIEQCWGCHDDAPQDGLFPLPE